MELTNDQLAGDSSDLSSLTFANDLLLSDSGLQDGGFSELSAALAAAQGAQSQTDTPWLTDTTPEPTSNHSTAASSPLTPGPPAPHATTRPKLGTSRFSTEVIRTLKNWLAAHQQHPYPRNDDMVFLQQRTGLNQAQLTNWFANARRRGKVQSIRPSSPQVRNHATIPIDIIKRPGTPAIRQDPRSKDPLQRWVDSPPEHEPADVGDIARAMKSSSGKHSYVNNVKGFDYAYNDYRQSPHLSSASSAGTSHSSEASNRYSSGSQNSIKVRRPSRRKRAARRRPLEADVVNNHNMPYQCTFCTEVFKTKYDWQRHEKSLHLPLEQWVCALHGPRAPHAESSQLCCVFCGETAPGDDHIEAHQYSACQERSIEERTFHRKDHLVQHLRLVHGAKFEAWSMKNWMIPIPDIQSRCGFCALEMTTWLDRTDHLADHFKVGATMADWKGDWGFDDSTKRLVENSVPPYMIDYERSTLVPMRASDSPWGSPPNGYELLKIEIEFFIQNYSDNNGVLPTNDVIQFEACRIIFAADASLDADLPTDPMAYRESWLRDLVMSSPDLARQARFGPIKSASESRHSSLKINGKDAIFEHCPLEAQLRAFVLEQQISGGPLDDVQLQTQMCEIVRQMEKTSQTPSDMFANWVVKGIYSGPEWLGNFKSRAGIANAVDSPGSNSGLQPQHIMDEWAQLTQQPLSSFDPDHAFSPTHDQLSSFHEDEFLRASTSMFPDMTSATFDAAPALPIVSSALFDMNDRPRVLLPDDTNFHRVFESDIRRWVAATMSPKNPNCHVPSDEEIQHQARWIMYNGDDPWNQTPADYAEWLWRFKKDVGISSDLKAIDPAELTKQV